MQGSGGKRRASSPVTLLAALGLLAGCGSGTKTVIVQGPPPAGTASAVSGGTSSTGSSSSGTSSTTTVMSPPPTSFVHVEAFQSPTGNIGCMLVSALARCDIVRRAWSPPPHPASCPQIVDFGQGLEVGTAGSGRFVCAGDTVSNPASAKLAYGVATQVSGFECVSRSTGMTCTNSATGHGFILSVQSYKLF